MIKLLITAIAFTTLSFRTQEEKKVTLILTPNEVVIIYDALGERPAKVVETLRAKIAAEYNRQMNDTTKKK